VLLVDQDEETRRIFRESLQLDLWRTDEAADGREALAKALASTPDLVVTDIRLPGIGGLDLCRLLRKDALTQAVSIVVVTEDAYPLDMQRAKEAGADLVLAKPCPPEQIRAEAQRLVERARSLRSKAGSSRERAAKAVSRAEEVLATSHAVSHVTDDDERRSTRFMNRTHHRMDTTTPPTPPPSLVCPHCDRVLVYERSHIGGVSPRHLEQWDYFQCIRGCGMFQYRVRTRKLRRVL
jgi:CheY-like chemotaxis protein